ncbi:hypothetical protein ACIPZ8_15000 [Pseudomonas sp. NPDC089422]|uniref:hypothetical protein n=1 Tax=Pseudomonas sp. NPDC089422 TaxID=3364466 RepID=UPI00381323C3
MRTAVIDEQIISALVMALARNPRASLQELSNTVGIGKTTLYRFAKTRDELIDKLRARCVGALAEASNKAKLESAPVEQAFRSLVDNHLAEKEACAFLLNYWRSPLTQQARQTDEQWIAYEQGMEAFFMRGQREGLFRVGPSAICLSDMFGYVIAGLADSALSGRIALLGLETQAYELLLNGMHAQ